MDTQYLPQQFKEFGPVLPNVKIVEIWDYYDGPLCGICEIEGMKFFFSDIIYDIWRAYSEEDMDRLWCIYAVYDINIDKAIDIIKEAERSSWQEELHDLSEVVGIFWEYIEEN